MKKLFAAAMALAVILCVSGCSKVPQKTPEEIVSEDYPAVDAEKAVGIGDTVSAVNLFNQTFTYRVNHVDITKSLGSYGSFHLFEDADEREKLGDDGTLQSDLSFVFVDITICNQQQESLRPYMNSLKLQDSTQGNTATGAGLRYLDPIQAAEGDPDQFAYEFGPGEEVTFTLGYIVPDDTLDHIYLVVGKDFFDPAQAAGAETVEGDHKAISLNSK